MFKITFKQYREWLNEWEKAEAEHTPLRKGQHFCNYFKLTDPRLFNSTSLREINDLINDFIDG
jgi:hypothetical protein